MVTALGCFGGDFNMTTNTQEGKKEKESQYQYIFLGDCKSNEGDHGRKDVPNRANAHTQLAGKLALASHAPPRHAGRAFALLTKTYHGRRKVDLFLASLGYDLRVDRALEINFIAIASFLASTRI